jgi:hypothetical protein
MAVAAPPMMVRARPLRVQPMPVITAPTMPKMVPGRPSAVAPSAKSLRARVRGFGLDRHSVAARHLLRAGEQGGRKGRARLDVPRMFSEPYRPGSPTKIFEFLFKFCYVGRMRLELTTVGL